VGILGQEGGILLAQAEEEGRPLGIAQGDGLDGTRHRRRNGGTLLLLLLLLLKGRNQLLLLHLLNLMGIGIGRRQCMPLGMLAVQIPRHLLQLRMLLLLGGGSKPRSMEDLRIRVRPARRGGRRTEEAGGVGIAGVGRLGLGLGLGLGLSPGQIQLGGGLLLLRGRDDSGLLMILRLLLLLLLCSPPAAGGGVLAEEGVVRIICSRHDLLAGCGLSIFIFWAVTVPRLQRRENVSLDLCDERKIGTNKMCRFFQPK
jgi:hypothetical protein